jgi:hypothetical protein
MRRHTLLISSLARSKRLNTNSWRLGFEVAWRFTPDGQIVIRKASAHGLGHLLAPYHPDGAPARIAAPIIPLKDIGVERWQHDLWHQVIRATLDGYPDEVDLDFHPNLNQPAASRYGSTTPELLGWFKRHNTGLPYAATVRPFNFLLSFQLAPTAFPSFLSLRKLSLLECRQSQKLSNGQSRPHLTIEMSSPLQTTVLIEILATLRATFYRLCLIRALGGYEAERSFVLDHQDAIRRSSLNPSLADAAFAFLSGAPHDGYVRCTAALDIFHYLIASFVNIGFATKNADLAVLKRQVSDLYQRDQQAHLFLNWAAIHNSFELPAVESDVHTIFLKLLMLHPTIGRRFRTVSLARGKGHLVADLTSFVARLRSEFLPTKRPQADRGNIEFVKRVKKLPSAAAAKLMEEIIEKGMMERLAFAFSTSISLSASALPRVDNQASILRLEFANLGLRTRVLPERVANRIIDEETHFLRMHKFHTLFRAGRVKIDWDYLKFLAEDLIRENFSFLISDTSERTIDNSVLENVIKLFSEELSDILLFDSESSLEQALNNNVRHGVLVPRFVKEFNEALVAALDYQGHPGDLSDDTYARFGGNSKLLLTLKEHITNKVNAYKDYWLTVQRDGDFQNATRQMIADITRTMGMEVDSAKLAEAIVGEFQTRVDQVLAEAHQVFMNSVKPAVYSDISDFRVKCSQTPSKNVTAFLDLLDTSIGNGNIRRLHSSAKVNRIEETIGHWYQGRC